MNDLLDPSKWSAERFEAAWSSYKLRSELEKLELDQRSLVAAMYASGSGGDDLGKILDKMNQGFIERKSKLIEFYRGSDLAEAQRKRDEDSTEFVTEEWWK